VTPRAGPFLTKRAWFILHLYRTSRWHYMRKILALGIVVSEDKFFEDHIFSSCDLIMQQTSFCRKPPKDHSCKVWSKSSGLGKKLYIENVHNSNRQKLQMTDTLPSLKLISEHFVLRWAKTANLTIYHSLFWAV
jgi:hypothetical protein